MLNVRRGHQRRWADTLMLDVVDAVFNEANEDLQQYSRLAVSRAMNLSILKQIQRELPGN